MRLLLDNLFWAVLILTVIFGSMFWYCQGLPTY